MSKSILSSSFVTKLIATPFLPNLPLRPIRCRSVVMRTREDPERNSRIIMSLVFWSMSPWVADTVWSRPLILSVSQSTLRRHFISLIQYKHLNVIGTKRLPTQHVKDTPRSSDNYMNSTGKNALVLTDTGSSNTSMYLDTKIVSQCPHNLLNLLCKFTSRCQDQSLTFHCFIVELLKNTRAESSSLPSSRLSLLNYIETFAEWNNTSLLNC
nr:hypothetical protein BE221DRAFT_92416 [Ipomoea trifida]